MINVLKRNPSFIAYTIFSLLIIAAFVRTDNAREEARKDTCRAALDGALTLRDLIDFSVARSQNPEAQEVVQKFYERIEIPPKICDGTGIDTEEFFRRDRSDSTDPVPNVDPSQSSSTTGEGIGRTSTTQPEARSPPDTRPPDRQDPPPSTTTTTTTTAPTTTTTQNPNECTISVSGRCVVDVNPGTAHRWMRFAIFPLRMWH